MDQLIEVSVGESFMVGQYLITVLDTDGDELFIEITNGDTDEVVTSEFEQFDFLSGLVES